MDDKVIMDPIAIYKLMILGRDWYYNKLINIENDLTTIEKNPNIKFYTAHTLLTIEKAKCNEEIEEATKTIDTFKKAHNLY